MSFFCNLLWAQGLQIDLNSYSHEELITDVLINDPCNESEIENIEVYGGHLFNTPSIAYFTNTNPDFPIERGVILSTGSVYNAPGPNNSTQSAGDANWDGDEQLRAYMQPYDPGLTETYNASILTFDFKPSSNFISFNFMFVSEEYGTFQCDYSDAFAFFLTNHDTGQVTNLAIVPGTNDPISVITIRDSQYNGGCESVNPEYFGNYFPLGNNNAAHNFNGETVLLTAVSDVTPNTTYSIKLVIADRNDSSYDSAVLLEAGSFSLTSANLGEDLTIETGTALCDDQTHTLTVDYQESYVYTWFLNGEILPGEVGHELVVNQPGNYTVEVQLLPGDCTITDDILVEAFDFTNLEPQNLTICEGLESNIFDLSTNQFQGFNSSFFTSLEDAEANEDAIATEDIDSYAGEDGDVIWMRIETQNGECAVFRSFSLNTISLDIPEETPVFDYCAPLTGNATLTTNLSEFLPQLVADPTIFTFQYYTSQADAVAGNNPINNPQAYNWSETQEIFVIFTSPESGCSGMAQFTLQLNFGPDNVNIPLVQICQQDPQSESTNLDLQEIRDLYLAQNPNLQFQFYLSEDDAVNQQNQISEYSITGFDQQQLSVLLSTPGNECFTLSTLDIVVNPLPQVPQPQVFEVCNVETQGFASFDLEMIEDHFDPQGIYVITFHTSISDAQAAINPLASPYTNTQAYEQTIFVRIQNANNDCYLVLEQVIRVTESLTTVGPFLPEVCEDSTIDGYNFTLQYLQELYNAANYSGSITFHTSAADAESGVNGVQTAIFVEAGESTTIYVRFTDASGNCYDFVEEVLSVQTAPENPEPIGTVFCDENGTGLYTFNLQQLSQQYLQAYNNHTLTFHLTQQDAAGNNNPLPATYTNTTPFEQTIYYRLTDLATGCFTTGTHLLEVLANVDLVDNLQVPMCDTNFDNVFQINITHYYAGLLQSGLVSSYDITVYNSAVDAENQQNPIAQPGNIELQALPQTYWVRFNVSGQPCYDITSITFTELPQVHIVSNIMPIQLCEEQNGQSTLNFQQYHSQFSTHQGAVFSFYSTEQAASNAQNPLPEQLLTAGGTYWVRVEAENRCPAIAQFDVELNPMPQAALSVAQSTICQGENTQITNTVSYSEAMDFLWQDDTGAIFSPAADGSIQYTGIPGVRTVSLIVTHPISGCSITVFTEVHVVQTPQVTAVNIEGNTASIIASPNTGLEYSLDGVNWQFMNHFSNLENGLHQVYVRAIGSDCVSQVYEFLILNVNNVITPNGDGLNDYFVISHLDVFRGENGEILPSTLHIFNRQGKLLYTDTARPGVERFVWDGTYGGRPVNTGTYWYMLKLADGREFSGHITVKRK